MRGFFDRFRHRHAEAQARALVERGLALHESSEQAPDAYKVPRLLEAIQCYQDALIIFTERDFPMEWAAAQGTLGNAYMDLPKGKREANLEKAIACYQAALRLFKERDFPEAWAGTQNMLGFAYADLPTGDRRENLTKAIACFQAALRVYTERDFPVEWVRVQNNLGYAYANLPTVDRRANLEKAIACYQAALRVYTEWEFPVEWARVQNDIGIAYWDLTAGDWGANLKKAITCFQAALRVYTEQDFPVDWAMMQSNLGGIYAVLPTGDRQANLGIAVTCYQAGLRVYTERDFPVEWARTLNNLGNAYADLPTGDRGMNLREAISCFQAALRVYTERDFPVEWARAQSNLGAAYVDLPIGDQEVNLKEAISCFQAALRVYTEQDFPTQWANTQTNLGAAYRNLPSGDGGAKLKEPISCFRAALRVYTERDFPVEWARTLNNLGNVYTDLPTGNQGRDLSAAIACYQAALRVYKKRDFPILWAVTQNNLGAAYWNLPIGDRRANLEAAITCYQAALQVQMPETLPLDCLRTLHNLSGLHYREQHWHEALAICEEGMRVLESVRAEALTAAERTRLLSENAALFDWAVISAMELGQFADALVYVERGKTRNLVETLTRRDVKPRGIVEMEWRDYLDRLNEVQNLERQLAAGSLYDPAAAERYQQIRENLARVRREIEECEARFRATDPDYLPTAMPLTFDDTRAVIRQANAVLVEFRVTEAGTFVFLLNGDDADVTEEQVVGMPEFTSDVLHEMLIKREDGRAVDGWLVKYYQWHSEEVSRQEWMDCMERVTGELYARLLRPVHERLKKLYPHAKRLILVPNKGLNLLPLHAAHNGTNGAGRDAPPLLDDYEIIYAPSCAVLRRCLRRESKHGKREALFAVQNPLGDLPFGDWDVEETARYFPVKHILPGAEATLAQVKRFIAEGHEVLLSCHGAYNLNDVFESQFLLHGDDRLRLSDILQLDLSNAWLIVLSACESAVSDFRDVVDEVQGLHTAFLIARAPTVVGSLWSVSDLSTALMMKRFHENLYERNMSKVSALREAQIWLRELPVAEARRLLNEKRMELEQVNARERMAKIDLATARFNLEELAAAHDGKPFAHPYWWAAFQCVGAG